jgi:hypothetical protein
MQMVTLAQDMIEKVKAKDIASLINDAIQFVQLG